MIVSPSKELLHLLSQEVEQAVLLLEALRLENEALAERQSDAIETAVRAKQAQLEVFELCERNRRQWLKQAGVTEERSAIREFLSTQPEVPTELISEWDRLLELATQCHNQNKANGALVEIHRRHVQRALDLLRGTQDTPTYGPAGEARGRDDTHSLAKA